MKTKQPVLGLFLFLLLLCVRLSAEPLNVMVEDLTFTRPEKWLWAEPTESSPAVTRFVVPEAGGTSVDVRFYVVKKDYSNERKALQTQFPEAKAEDLHEQELKIGRRKVVYLEIEGTYVFRDHHPKPDQLWVGAVIPKGKEYVYARIQGPRSEVQGQLATFKKMVEDAVTEREAELAAN